MLIKCSITLENNNDLTMNTVWLSNDNTIWFNNSLTMNTVSHKNTTYLYVMVLTSVLKYWSPVWNWSNPSDCHTPSRWPKMCFSKRSLPSKTPRTIQIVPWISQKGSSSYRFCCARMQWPSRRHCKWEKQMTLIYVH